MIDIDSALRQVRVDFPETPELVDRVLAAITAESAPSRRAPWRPALARVGAALAVIVLVVALIPASRERVASWLGIRGVTIVDVTTTSGPPPTPTTEGTATPTTGAGLAIGLDLGEEIAFDEALAIVGFEPLVPADLGMPDAVFADDARLWMLYASRPGLPDTAAPGVGAIVAQFPFATAPGVTKQLLGGPQAGQFVEVSGDFAVWVEGPHELLLPGLDGSAVQGRSAGNTLLWERGPLTIRLEVALPLSEAIRIAESFE